MHFAVEFFIIEAAKWGPWYVTSHSMLPKQEIHFKTLFAATSLSALIHGCNQIYQLSSSLVTGVKFFCCLVIVPYGEGRSAKLHLAFHHAERFTLIVVCVLRFSIWCNVRISKCSVRCLALFPASSERFRSLPSSLHTPYLHNGLPLQFLNTNYLLHSVSIFSAYS